MTDTKITFESLLKGKEVESKVVKINEIAINVKQYLPIDEKIKLIGKVVSLLAGNEYNFINPIHLDVYTTVEIIKSYSDIAFDEEMNITELYDKLEIENIANVVIAAIPSEEYNFILSGVADTASAYFTYKNSILGIMESITKDYSNLNLDASEIQKKIEDPNNLSLLKDIMKKMG